MIVYYICIQYFHVVLHGLLLNSCFQVCVSAYDTKVEIFWRQLCLLITFKWKGGLYNRVCNVTY